MASIKIAVAQIAYLPAIRLWVEHRPLIGEEQPLFFCSHPDELAQQSEDSALLLSTGGVSFAEQYETFRRSYPETLLRELTHCLAHCGQLGVSLLVLPEYSVPASLISRLHDVVRQHGVSVVAGTHAVRDADIEAHPCAPVLRVAAVGQKLFAVCPVLVPDQTAPVLFIKGIYSRFEDGFDAPQIPSRDLVSIPVKDQKGRCNVGIVICSEFVVGAHDPAEAESASYIQTSMEQADVVAITALTPKVKPFHEDSRTFLASRPHGSYGTFAFANHAIYGGSSITCRGDDDNEGMAPRVESLLVRTVFRTRFPGQ